MRRFTVIITAALSVAFLIGADGCPLTVDTSGTGQGSSSSTSSSSLDVGGTSGAKWQLTFDQEILVTLRLTSGSAAAKKVPQGTGIAELLGGTISVGDLCWRTDLVCPQGVLPEQTTVQQPSTGGVLVSFNHRGALAGVADAGLTGTLSNTDLDVPLNVASTTMGLCTLGSGSAILASAYASDGSHADSLQGRIIVAYSGTCANLGGAVIPADSQLELSLGFSGKRL